MKKTLIYVAVTVAAVAAATIAVLGVSLSGEKRRCSELSERVGEQAKVIDSLLNRREKFIDVQLNVTDKSKSTIYGKYNKGTITMPQEKTYHLEIDSSNVSIK